MQRRFTTFGLSLWVVVTLLLPLSTTPAQAADRPPKQASSTATVLGFAQNGVTDAAVQPDLSGVVVTLADLPAGFEPVPLTDMDLATAGIGLQEAGAENLFVFQNPRRPVFIMGFVGLVPTNLQRAFFDSVMANPQDLLMLVAAGMPSGYELQPFTPFTVTGVGEKAVGVTTTATILFGSSVRLDMILFRREMVGVIVVIAYPEEQTPAITATAIAHLLDERTIAALTGAPTAAVPGNQPQPTAKLADQQDAIATAAEALPEAEVLVKQLNVRTGPGATYPVVDGVQVSERLSIVGQANNCAWLQIVTPTGTTGWVSAAKQYITFAVACDQIKTEEFRPRTGTLLGGAVQLAGAGQLLVQSEYRNDAVVVLTRLDGTPVTAFYLRGYEAFTLLGIPEGRYQVVYTTGERWDQQTGRFGKSVRYRQFDGDYAIDTTLFASTVHTLRIRPTTGGTTAIAADEFPDLGQGN